MHTHIKNIKNNAIQIVKGSKPLNCTEPELFNSKLFFTPTTSAKTSVAMDRWQGFLRHVSTKYQLWVEQEKEVLLNMPGYLLNKGYGSCNK